MQKIPGGNVMKTLSLAIISVAIVLASCSSPRYAASSEYDDVYYNPTMAPTQTAVVVEEPVVTPQAAMNAQPIAQAPVYTESQVNVNDNLSDYERYQITKRGGDVGRKL